MISVLQSRYFYRYGGSSGIQFNDYLPFVSSVDNYFVPFFAGIDGSIIRSGIHKALIYNIRVAKNGDNARDIPISLNRFINFIHTGDRYAVTKDQLSDTIYYTMKHFIFTINEGKVNPLYCLCSTRQDIFDMKPGFEPDFKRVFLIINNEINTPRHKKIAIRIKGLIKIFVEKGVNVIYTDDPSGLFLRQGPNTQNFKSIEERLAFINETKKQLGFYGSRPEQIKKPVTEFQPDPSIIADSWG